MEQTTQLVTKVGHISQLNDAAQKAFKTFEERQRFRSNTNLSRFHRELEKKYQVKVDDKALLEMFKALEGAGMGSLIIGRKSSNTRFQWQYSLRDVAKLAKGEIVASEAQKINGKAVRTVKRIVPTYRKPEVAPAPVAAAAPVAVSEGLSEFIIIQNGDLKRFSLPADKVQIFKDLLNVFSHGA